MFFYDALKPFSFGAADDIHELSRLELVYVDVQLSLDIRSIR